MAHLGKGPNNNVSTILYNNYLSSLCESFKFDILFQSDFFHECCIFCSDDAPSSATENVGLVTIPVAPPPTLVNPDKPVAMASAPTHINSASLLTKQKLLQSIQAKEQQKMLEQAISQQLGVSVSSVSSDLLQALKSMSPVSD